MTNAGLDDINSVTELPPSPHDSASRSTVQDNVTSKPGRFVMNKVEKHWIIRQLIVKGAPTQRVKTLDRTCGVVAKDAQTRYVTDATVVYEQNTFGMSWRRGHMAQITADKVRHLAGNINEMGKKVVVASMVNEDDDDGLTAQARGKDGDAQHVLDQAVLDYKSEAAKRSLTSEEDASKAISKAQESCTQKQKRNQERRDAFEANKKRRASASEERERRKSVAELHLLRAQTRVANAANASAALQRRQSEQFEILTNLFAQSHNLQTQPPTTPLPPPLPHDALIVDMGADHRQTPLPGSSASASMAASLSSDALETSAEAVEIVTVERVEDGA